jgi:hypothetical protein
MTLDLFRIPIARCPSLVISTLRVHGGCPRSRINCLPAALSLRYAAMMRRSPLANNSAGHMPRPMLSKSSVPHRLRASSGWTKVPQWCRTFSRRPCGRQGRWYSAWIWQCPVKPVRPTAMCGRQVIMPSTMMRWATASSTMSPSVRLTPCVLTRSSGWRSWISTRIMVTAPNLSSHRGELGAIELEVEQHGVRHHSFLRFPQ